MPILELPPNPSRNPDSESGKATEGSSTHGLHPLRQHPIRVRTSRHGELEEQELIHLLDALDDERSRAQFRESVYISTIICLAIAWFLFYGPHVIFHVPYYKDPIKAMKERDQQLTLTMPATPHVPKAAPKMDRKSMDRLREQAREVPRTAPAPPTPQPPAPQPPQQAMNTPPPVAQPQMPLPAAPKAPQAAIPEAPMPSAPQPRIAQNSQSPGDAVRNAARGALGRSGADIGSNAPGAQGKLQAGATILTDTQGVDFSAYLRRLRSDLYRNWEPLIPEEVQAPLMKKGIVGIRFTILSDGQIGNMVLETRSGDVALDKAAWYAIVSEGQFPPLPRDFHGPQIELRVGFFYNQPVE